MLLDCIDPDLCPLSYFKSQDAYKYKTKLKKEKKVPAVGHLS